MKGNIGKTDKLVRIFAAFIFGMLVAFQVVTGVTAIIFLIVGAIFLLTALINFCPIWHFLGISTREKSNHSQHNQSA